MKWNFTISLLLAPLAYTIHHAEEHLLYTFRDWRLRYFADNNPLSTEAVFMILTAITLIYILFHAGFRNRASAYAILTFLMATQVVNAFFHLFGTIYFNDFSPGLITGLLLYLPVNAIIFHQALREGWVTWKSTLALFVIGALIFIAFEMVGPFPMVVVQLFFYTWIAYEAIKGRGKEGEAADQLG